MQHLTNIQAIEDAVDEYGEIVVSKNKNDKVIVMSMDEYKRKILEKEIGDKLLESEEDYKNGRVKKADDVFKGWSAKYGI